MQASASIIVVEPDASPAEVAELSRCRAPFGSCLAVILLGVRGFEHHRLGYKHIRVELLSLQAAAPVVPLPLGNTLLIDEIPHAPLIPAAARGSHPRRRHGLCAGTVATAGHLAPAGLWRPPGCLLRVRTVHLIETLEKATLPCFWHCSKMGVAQTCCSARMISQCHSSWLLPWSNCQHAALPVCRHRDILELLLDHTTGSAFPATLLAGPQADALGRSPLHFAAANGDYGAAQLLLARGANVDVSERRSCRQAPRRLEQTNFS